MKTRFLLCGLMMVISSDTVVAQSKPSDPPTAEERRESRKKARERDVDKLLGQFDKNKDKVLTDSELPKALREYLALLDTDGDGMLDRVELLKMSGRPGSKAGEIITGPAKGERYNDKIEVGDTAPDFRLADSSGKRMVTLSAFRAKKPVVLIFGSYT